MRGRSKSGGRAHQRASKTQSKAAQPSPTSCSHSKKQPIPEDVQSQLSAAAEEPDAAPPPSSQGAAETRSDSTGQMLSR